MAHQDWICLDTLGAACAEPGDFDSAVKWANQALERAPPESRDEIRQRVGLYREGRPYHLE
jgi:Flp pilus assembly protein TadD